MNIFTHKNDCKAQHKLFFSVCIVILIAIVVCLYFFVINNPATEILSKEELEIQKMVNDYSTFKSYDSLKEQVKINETNDTNKEVGSVKLITPLNKIIGAGHGDFFAEMELELKRDYNQPFQKVHYYQTYDYKKIGTKIETGQWSLKIYNSTGTYKQRINNYTETCIPNKDTKNLTNECTTELFNSYDVTKYGTWESLSKNLTLLKGNHTIRLYYVGDYKGKIEFIPEILNVPITEWASFVDVFRPIYHLAQDDSYQCSATEWVALTFNPNVTGEIVGMSVGLWRTGTPGMNFTICTTVTDDKPNINNCTTLNASFNTADVASTGAPGESTNITFINPYTITQGMVDTNTNLSIVMACDGTRMRVRKDKSVGDTDQNTFFGIASGWTLNFPLRFELFYSNAVANTLPNVNLISPINNFETTNNIIDINCTATDLNSGAGDGVVNLTLMIDGVDNLTITNSTAGENLTFYNPITIADGTHVWNCKACDTAGCNTTGTNRTFLVDNQTISFNWADNLELYYPLDQITGDNQIDVTGNGHDGTGINLDNTNWIIGTMGKGLVFDNVNEQINITNVSNLKFDTGQDFSIFFWVNSTQNNDIFIGDWNGTTGWQIGTTLSLLFMKLENSSDAFSIHTNINITDSQWHHVGIIVNRTGLAKIYIDSVFKNSTNVTGLGNISSHLNTIVIGNAFNGASPFGGRIDEVGIWRKVLKIGEIEKLYNTGLAYEYNNIRPYLLTPTNNSEVSGSDGNNFTVELNTTTDYSFVNATFMLWNSSNFLSNKTTKTITGTNKNVTSFIIDDIDVDNFRWNVYACVENATNFSSCSYALENYTVIRNSFTVLNNLFNVSSYETKTEQFIVNLSFNSSDLTFDTATLNYDGTSYNVTTAQNGDLLLITSQDIDIPTASTNEENKTFFWNIDFTTQTQNSINFQQTINLSVLDLCNSTLTTAYINFTFINETDSLENISATVSSDWTYWLGSNMVNKSLSYINTSQNENYSFCFSPQNKQLNVRVEMDYDNSESEPRVYALVNGLLTNSTTNQILHLLPTALGTFTRYQTITNNGDIVKDVLASVTRTISTSTINAGLGLTDDAGIITFFLNPTKTYDFVFSKTGYPNNSFSIVPVSPEIHLVIMGTTSSVGNFTTTVLENSTVQITPSNATLSNNTDVTFGLNVTGGDDITFISMNITNGTNSQMVFVSDTSVGYISALNNTGNLSKIIGYYEIRTATENITLTRTWFIGTEFQGAYSFDRQMRYFMSYNFSTFARTIIIIATLILIIIFLSTTQVIDINKGEIIIIMLVVWVFSFVGWLDTGAVMNSSVESLNTLMSLSNQFGIAILTTIFSVWAIVRRIA